MARTFEDRGRHVIMSTCFRGEPAGKDTIITDNHHKDAHIAASTSAKKVAQQNEANIYRMRMKLMQALLMDIELLGSSTH